MGFDDLFIVFDTMYYCNIRSYDARQLHYQLDTVFKQLSLLEQLPKTLNKNCQHAKGHSFTYFVQIRTWNLKYRNRNRNKFINQIRAPGGHIQITSMIDTQQQYIKLNIRGEISIIVVLLHW